MTIGSYQTWSAPELLSRIFTILKHANGVDVVEGVSNV